MMHFFYKLLIPLAIAKFYFSFKSFRKSYLSNLKVRFSGYCFADPSEHVTYYHHFFDLVNKDTKSTIPLNILDLGSPKYIPISLSNFHSVHSSVLVDPIDSFSNVKYFVGDFLDESFESNYYDFFVSPVTLNLLGLGRYGDKLNFNALPQAVNKIHNLLKPNGSCLLALTVGNNFLSFNNGIYLDHMSIIDLFRDFNLVDITPLSVHKSNIGSYTIVYYKLIKSSS